MAVNQYEYLSGTITVNADAPEDWQGTDELPFGRTRTLVPGVIHSVGFSITRQFTSGSSCPRPTSPILWHRGVTTD
jgi:hypothetical protein